MMVAMFKMRRKKCLEIKMKKFATPQEFSVNLEHRLNVRVNLQTAIGDRLTHPKVRILHGTVETVSKRVAFDLEESCFKAARSGGFYLYQSLITEFFLHICPYFKTARHSMVFRDMLIGYKMRGDDGGIPDSINIAKRAKEELWPELFDNKYLSRDQRTSVMELRQLEFGIVADLIRKMEVSKRVVFVMDQIALSQTSICYGQSNACWSTPEPQMNVKCLTSGTCDEISMCMPYEDFLIHFADHGMLGSVSDPADPEKILKLTTVENIRRVWNVELKMTRVYLDILNAMDDE
jgi:hypothetical protein